MEYLWPPPGDGLAGHQVTDADLERIYGYPDGLTEPWVQVNFVSSADGAASVAHRSEGLSHPADKRIFTLGRDLADVVLAGAGTVEVENYKGVRPRQARVERRRRLGLSDVPPIAVVSGRCTLRPDAALLTDTTVSPIVITTEAAERDRRHALEQAGAEVLIAGAEQVDLASAMAQLAHRGLRRVNCEGGPHLFASLLAQDLVDQLCLTLAPLVTGPGPGRIVAGSGTDVPHHLRLVSLLHEDGFCMFRYRRGGA